MTLRTNTLVSLVVNAQVFKNVLVFGNLTEQYHLTFVSGLGLI